ncbi:MAG: hypothetical protein ACE5E5_08515 [Phycisphaerae bacterium]
MPVLRSLALLPLVLAVPVAIAGCSTMSEPPPEVQPDLKAIEVVVAGAYGLLASPARVFLTADGVADDKMANAYSSLGTTLPADFRASSARASGAAGASIVLGRFHDVSVNGDGARLSVVASFVEESGSSRGCHTYVLERDADVWTLVDEANAWPDCPISRQGEDSYHDALERARGPECMRLGTGIGTCGPWLYVVESTGFTGAASYFDPQTGLLVARRIFDDTGVNDFVFEENLGCASTVTESIPCDR